jgi:hypothetical protein
VLEVFHKQLDNDMYLLSEIFSGKFPGRKADLPPHREYNADEIAVNMPMFRGYALLPGRLKQLVSRIFCTTREGNGKMKVHYTHQGSAILRW